MFSHNQHRRLLPAISDTTCETVAVVHRRPCL